jgi:2-phospho-L-lactate guanylyltransferase
MIVHVVLAVRGGPGAKSRCRERLGETRRRRLVEVMLDDMLAALAGAHRVDAVHVVTPNPALADRAQSAGAGAVLQDRTSDLNHAFEAGRRRVAEFDPDALAVFLPGDLPLLLSEELDACIAAAGAGRVVLVPAAGDGGTGALIFRAGTPFAFAFGPDSCRRHTAAAKALGLEVVLMAAPSLAFDLDGPMDIDLMLGTSRSGRTAAALKIWLGRAAA